MVRGMAQMVDLAKSGVAKLKQAVGPLPLSLGQALGIGDPEPPVYRMSCRPSCQVATKMPSTACDAAPIWA
jgi:hypothetical protein